MIAATPAPADTASCAAVRFEPRSRIMNLTRCTWAQWTRAGAWPRIHRAVLDELSSQGLID